MNYHMITGLFIPERVYSGPRRGMAARYHGAPQYAAPRG